MNNELVREIANAALKVLKPLASTTADKTIVANFEQSAQYADCFMRAFRKGGGFLGLGVPDQSQPISSLDIAITLRPNVLIPEWVGYTIDIKDPETNPSITLFREWPQAGGENDAPIEKMAELKPHILNVAQLPRTAGNSTPPREAPISMF